MRKITICFIFLCFCANPAWAQWITIEITAQVNSVTDGGGLEGKIHIGDTITGTYTYDSTVPDSYSSSPIWGTYENTTFPAGLSLECNGFVFKTNPDDFRFIINIENGTTGVDVWADTYGIGSYNNLPLSNGSPLNVITWTIHYSSRDTLSNDALQVTAPDLSSGISHNELYIDGMRGSDFRIYAQVTSTKLVPEPASAFLVIAGMGLLRLRNRKK